MNNHSTQERSSQIQTDLADASCFIEQQFPVAKISIESYKERKSGIGQTLTCLGKWWGRKPLVLVRAALLGLLMPTSDEPKKDLEIFLKLMTMDGEGLWQRKNIPIPQARLLEELQKMPPSIQHRFLIENEATKVQIVRPFTRREAHEKEELQRLVFEKMPYVEKLAYCLRPELIEGPSPQSWREINLHLGTNARSLDDLVQELGKRRFGRVPRVGDTFCGGGSIPFEVARLGCEAYGSDLNPVAALLTWASLSIVGGGPEISERLFELQKTISIAVESQINALGIEQNSKGWFADAYLYCVVVKCPECGWRIPLAPSWVIAEKNNVIAKLIPNEGARCFNFNVVEAASPQEFKNARIGTIINSRMECAHCHMSTPIQVIRRNLRLWENEDLSPRADDVFQERLYCVRWVETNTLDNKKVVQRHFHSPTSEDIQRENIVLEFLKENFQEWQLKGYLPTRQIEPGYNTDQPIRERGWTYWHHLFTPRQLLGHGLILKYIDKLIIDPVLKAAAILLVGSSCNWNSKLCIWNSNLQKGGGIGVSEQTFANQALNTQFNYGTRAGSLFLNTFKNHISSIIKITNFDVMPLDAAQSKWFADIWITDPPYADAVNYHELSEFFLAWYEKHLPSLFPTWYTDSKRAMAIRGNDLVHFRQNMVSAYKNMANKMPENGLQIVLFTHQDASVWADLSMILWASGLRVTSAWTIATETTSGLKSGNYVQGTVLLVLRKRTETESVFLDEINHHVELEVRKQLDNMVALDDESDPNFSDSDYQLAAYAAALRVLTDRPIEEIDPEKEILRQRQPGEISIVEQLIRRAVKIACDHLLPRGLDPDLWKQLEPTERFYLKGLEVESHGEYRSGVYQELARGFGATDYTDLLAAIKANETRLKGASEFAKKMLSGEGFGNSLVRQCLFSIFLTTQDENTKEGMNWLHTELPDYWEIREKIVHIMEYLARLRFVTPMAHWEKDANAAALLAGAVRNDHV